MAFLEARLDKFGGPFLLGEELTLADIFVASHIFFRGIYNDMYENCHILQAVVNQNPKVKAWNEKMLDIFGDYMKKN